MGCAGSKGADASGAKPKAKKDEGEAAAAEEQPVSTKKDFLVLVTTVMIAYRFNSLHTGQTRLL